MLQGMGSGGDRLWEKNHLEEEIKKGSYAGKLIEKIANLHGDWL